MNQGLEFILFSLANHFIKFSLYCDFSFFVHLPGMHIHVKGCVRRSASPPCEVKLKVLSRVSSDFEQSGKMAAFYWQKRLSDGKIEL